MRHFHFRPSLLSMIGMAIGTGWVLAQVGLADGRADKPDKAKPAGHVRFGLSGGDPYFKSLTPRGEFDPIHSGIPACDDGGVCSKGVTAEGNFSNSCPGTDDDGWLSVAFPIQTDGAFVGAIEMVHLVNVATGHLYLLGDCGGNPDIHDIIYQGCDAIQPGAVGLQTYPIDPPVATGATAWVVAVFSEGNAFDVGFNPDQPGTGLGYGNLQFSGTCGNWIDLVNVTDGDENLGYCYCVSVNTVEPPSCCTVEFPPQCDGDVNGNGIVDPFDTGYVLSRFDQSVSLPGNCVADVNCDGIIDPFDSGYVLSRFDTCNPPLAPCAVGGGDCQSSN